MAQSGSAVAQRRADYTIGSAKRGNAMVEAKKEDRTYRNQIGLGDASAYKAHRGANPDSEEAAKAYLESKRKPKMTPPPGGAKGISTLAK